MSRLDYRRNSADQNLRGNSDFLCNEQTEKSRNSSGRAGAEGLEADFATDRHPETDIKRSQIAISVKSIVLSSLEWGELWVQIGGSSPVQSGVPLRAPRSSKYISC